MEDSGPEENRRDATILIKDGLTELVVENGKDGKPILVEKINNRSAHYKTQNINSSQFGLMAEYVEDFAAFQYTVKYSMSKPMADVLAEQIKLQTEIFDRSINAKSSENMRSKTSSQTSLIDKYLENKQEKVIDVKGELKRSIADMMMGKEADKSTN